MCVQCICEVSERVHDPPCSALNPCSGTLVEPVTNCSRRPLLSSLKASTACQNHRTTLLSLVQCFRRVLVFQSARSIFPNPPMINWKRGSERRRRGKDKTAHYKNCKPSSNDEYIMQKCNIQDNTLLMFSNYYFFREICVPQVLCDRKV